MPTLSQGHPCPQLFAKRHQTSIERMSAKISLQEEKGKKRKKEKRKRRRVRVK
jgi:hypothetical protein